MTTTLTVGADGQYHTIAAAIAAANNISGGVVIDVTAGTYVDDGGTVTNSNVRIQGVGGVARLVGAGPGTGGGAALVVDAPANVSLANLDISGVAGGAGVFVRSGMLTAGNVSIHDNAQGIASGPYPVGQISILYSDIGHNGANVAIGPASVLEIDYSAIHDASSGDEVRSRAGQTILSADLIADGAGAASIPIDLPSGGFLGVSSTTVEKGPHSTTASFIADGVSGADPASTVALIGDTFVDDVFPNAGTLLDHPIANLQLQGDLTWNLRSVSSTVAAGPSTYHALDARPTLPTAAQLTYGLDPAIAIITGNRDGGVTFAGTCVFDSTVVIADTVGGRTAIVGTTTADNTGKFSLTTHAKVDQTVQHHYTVSAQDTYGGVASMPGALVLADTGADHLTSAPGQKDVFAVMSFKGSDVIDGFKPYSAGIVHDVLNFSGRGITSFAQVQAMMSGTDSTVLTMASGKTVTLTGVSPSSLSAYDFAYS